MDRIKRPEDIGRRRRGFFSAGAVTIAAAQLRLIGGVAATSDERWLKHTLSWLDDEGDVRLDCRPVHLQPLSNEMFPIPPLGDSVDRGEAKRGPRAPARRIRRIVRRGRTTALIVALGSLAILSACAGEHAAQSGSTTLPGEKADTAGGGGRLDEIYREIYTPGNPRWSGF
jgi:hypothetical protein